MASTVGRWCHPNICNLFQKSGIDKLLPEMKMDDFLFSPIGYSMNGIMRESSEEHKDPSFMTIHVTPQPSCSYASFETNSSFASIGLICQVLEIFNPGKFILSFYSTEDSISFPLHEELKSCVQLQKWKRKELQICNNEGWELSYANFAAAVI